jgi:hypothetical protein
MLETSADSVIQNRLREEFRIQIPAQIPAIHLLLGKPIAHELESIPRSVGDLKVLISRVFQDLPPVNKRSGVLGCYLAVLSALVVP